VSEKSKEVSHTLSDKVVPLVLQPFMWMLICKFIFTCSCLLLRESGIVYSFKHVTSRLLKKDTHNIFLCENVAFDAHSPIMLMQHNHPVTYFNSILLDWKFYINFFANHNKIKFIRRLMFCSSGRMIDRIFIFIGRWRMESWVKMPNLV